MPAILEVDCSEARLPAIELVACKALARMPWFATLSWLARAAPRPPRPAAALRPPPPPLPPTCPPPPEPPPECTELALLEPAFDELAELVPLAARTGPAAINSAAKTISLVDMVAHRNSLMA